MVLVKGINCGFVTEAPTSDPLGTGSNEVDDWKHAIKDTAPTGAIKVTEIGWYCTTTTEDVNFEVGIYSHDASNDKPDAIIGFNTTNTKGTSIGWKVVTGLDITIIAGTVYWIAIQCDDTAPTATELYYEADVGERYSRGNLVSTLPNPWGTSTETDDYIWSIYALYEEEPPQPDQLTIRRLENIEIMNWTDMSTDFRFTIQGFNGTEEEKGYIDLFENVFYPGQTETQQRIMMYLEAPVGFFSTTDGDYIRLTFDGGNRVYVFFSSGGGVAAALYSIDTQGNLYWGPELNTLARESEIPPEYLPPEKKFPYWIFLFAPLLLIPFLKKKFK